MATSDPADNGSDQPRDQPGQQPEEGRTAHPSGVPAADIGSGFALGPMAPWDPPGRADLWDPASSTGTQDRPDGVRDTFPDGDERWADPEDSEFWASAVDPTPPPAPPGTGSGRSWLDDPIGDLAPAQPSLGTPPPSATNPEGAPSPWSTPQTPVTVPPAAANVPPPAYPQPPPSGGRRPPGPSAGPPAGGPPQSADPPPASPPPPPPQGPHPPMPPGGPVPPYPPNPPLPPPKSNNRLALILGLIALLLLCCCGSVAGSLLIWGDDLYEQIRDRSRQSIVHWDGTTD